MKIYCHVTLQVIRILSQQINEEKRIFIALDNLIFGTHKPFEKNIEFDILSSRTFLKGEVGRSPLYSTFTIERKAIPTYDIMHVSTTKP